MANTYKKPETKVVKVELQQMIAQQSKLNVNGEGNTQWGAKENNFDFFAFEEEEAPGKSDDDDSWDEDWEEEEF